ncbi:hypothetical protein D3C71_2215100 [compost metagenome]
MTINPLEYNPFPVQEHQLVLHLKTAEPDLLDNRFMQDILLIPYGDDGFVQIRRFRAP